MIAFIEGLTPEVRKYLNVPSPETSDNSGNCLQAPKPSVSLLSSARRMVKPSPFQGEDYGFESRAEFFSDEK